MADGEPARQYVVFDAARLLGREINEPLTPGSIDGPLWDHLNQMQLGLLKTDYTIESVPLVTFHPGGTDTIPIPPFTPQVVFSVSFPAEASAERFLTAVDRSIRRDGGPLLGIGVDPILTVGEFSVPEGPDGALFGTLDDARRLIEADQLPKDLNGSPVLDGTSVNVVVIDAGIDRNMVPASQWGGGWLPEDTDPKLPPPRPPGETTGTDALHGMMVVNNILAMAPRATIFDVPLIPPPKIYDIPKFLVAAHATFHKVLQDILSWRKLKKVHGPWVFVNSWAIFDRRSEGTHLGEYTQNRGPLGHPFMLELENVANEKFDIVFCAGNCGGVCPDGRCGPDDFGPGRGIWGANAHEDVLTLGAVRVDGIWPGYSSEGPGPAPKLHALKPDLCAPSQFVGASGRYPPSTGTSASAAIAAGIICALRSPKGWTQATVPPYILKLILNDTAKQPLGPGWNRRFGNGILDAGAAYEKLRDNYP